MRFGRGLWAALLLFVLVLCPLSAGAIGEVTGRLGGVVTIDGTKDGLSGVPIVVRSRQLIGGSRTVETGDDGSYLFQSLPPGTYELEAKIEGFAPVEQRGIVVKCPDPRQRPTGRSTAPAETPASATPSGYRVSSSIP